MNINELIKQALKSQNKTELRAYRNLKAEFLKAETAKNANLQMRLDKFKLLRNIVKLWKSQFQTFLRLIGRTQSQNVGMNWKY